MVSFDDLKVSLSTYIMRNKRVTYQDLLKWSSSNKVGNALLYLLIRELTREKRFKVSGEYVIGSIRVGNSEVKLSIPMYIEVPGEGIKHQCRLNARLNKDVSRAQASWRCLMRKRRQRLSKPR